MWLIGVKVLQSDENRVVFKKRTHEIVMNLLNPMMWHC
jgi:hypothetical protein